MSVSIHDLLNKSEHEQVLKSIRQSEANTSGEIRLYIEAHCKGDVLDRASLVFSKLDARVIFMGGYDNSFSSNSGYTTLDGKLSVKAGTLQVEKLKVK